MKNVVEKAFMLVSCALLITIGYGLATLTLPIEREYEQIAHRNALAFDYNYPDFVCTRFSDNLVLRLRAKGYFAWEQTVRPPQESCIKEPCLHSVVALVLPIDGTSGEVISPQRWEELGYEWFGSSTICQMCLGGLE